MLVRQVGITQATEICLHIGEGILAVTRSLIHLTGGEIMTDLAQSLEAENGHLVQSYILTVPLGMKVPQVMNMSQKANIHPLILADFVTAT